jgi:epoxyqueuosine reductase
MIAAGSHIVLVIKNSLREESFGLGLLVFGHGPGRIESCISAAKDGSLEYAAMTGDSRLPHSLSAAAGCSIPIPPFAFAHKTPYVKGVAPGSMSPSSPSPADRSGAQLYLTREQVRALACAAGFAEAGLVALPHANHQRDAQRFSEWVGAGRAGNMHYLERVGEDGRLLRSQVSVPFPWACSAVVCFANYNSAEPLSTAPAARGEGWIARYAWSSRVDASGARAASDYHKVLMKRLATLEAHLREQHGPFEARGYVDTGPVVERALATAAGLGWTGKNTCLIHPRLGSFGFLAVLLTSLPVKDEKSPAALVPDRCGSCRRCLDACPTGALIAPYQMDASLCISYLTIEHHGAIDASLMEGMGRQVFGCDICQDVCPWNRKAPIGADPDLEPRPELVNPSLDWLAALDEAQWEKLFNGSPVRRAGFQGLRRNVAAAMGNSGLARFAPSLLAWANAADHGLRTAAQWALARLEARPNPPSAP